jgi:hypothetical protein
LKTLATLALTALISSPLVAMESKVSQYLHSVFGQDLPKAKAIWLTGDLKGKVTQALGSAPSKLREKVWQKDQTQVFILEQIGKVKPITTAWKVVDGKILETKVLIYRESRGGEVRFPFFTDQFQGVGLKSPEKLNHDIDGISGATLSVWAMKKMARQALVLHQHLDKK